MNTEVLFVRVPVGLKVEAEAEAEAHGVSLSKLATRALEVYLSEHCGRQLSEVMGRLP